MNDLGVYIHIPFCASKCPYCDFYSVRADKKYIDEYINTLIFKIRYWSEKLNRTADTIYFGGGTSSIIGSANLCTVLETLISGFSVSDPEITVEVNPFSSVSKKYEFNFEKIRSAGFNRISIGLQSGNDNELLKLGRLHNSEQVKACIKQAQSAGFDNISLDLMLATPLQTFESLERSIEFCAKQNVQHISAYMLKIERGTRFYETADKLNLPDDDTQADIYLFACKKLEEYGYEQYEISNFAKKGFASRHNLKYWNCDEYIGIGSSAHSFVNGKRFYTPRSIEDFKNGIIISDGSGGSEEEYTMLRLRLSDGINNAEYNARFGHDIPERYFDSAKPLFKAGYVNIDSNFIRLTPKGFLVSNSIISKIIQD